MRVVGAAQRPVPVILDRHRTVRLLHFAAARLFQGTTEIVWLAHDHLHVRIRVSITSWSAARWVTCCGPAWRKSDGNLASARRRGRRMSAARPRRLPVRIHRRSDLRIRLRPGCMDMAYPIPRPVRGAGKKKRPQRGILASPAARIGHLARRAQISQQDRHLPQRRQLQTQEPRPGPGPGPGRGRSMKPEEDQNSVAARGSKFGCR